MRCTSCGFESPAGKKFCSECGSGLAHLCPQCDAELIHRGLSQPHALRQTYTRIYEAVIVQASVQAYIDAAWVLAIACLVMVPMALLLKNSDSRQPQVSEI